MSTELRGRLEDRCRDLDIPIMGIGSAESWNHPPFHPFVPEEARPRSIMPSARSVVVIGIPLPMPAIESAPSIWYADTYRTVNQLLDQASYRLSLFLESEGHLAAFLPRDGYADLEALRLDPSAFFSHRHAAVLAGLGAFGVNNVVLTREYGPRVRFASLLTDAVLPVDGVLEEELCIRCMECVRMCPSNAIGGGDYPDEMTDKSACTEYSAILRAKGISPCGMCLRVCPVGEDRDHWGNKDVSVYSQEGEQSERWDHVRRHGAI